MKIKLLTIVIGLALSVFVNAQELKQTASEETKISSSSLAKSSSKPNSAEKNSTTTKKQVPANGAYVRPPAKKRFGRYINSMVGPMSLARTVAGAGYATWRNKPEEWGTHWEGFGRRVAANFGRNAIKQTVMYGLDESFKLDSRFYRTGNKKGFGSRLGNALISPLTARKPDGKKVFGFPRVAATYSANVIASETMFPERFDYKDGLRRATISLGWNAAFNVFKEFVFK